MAAYVTVDRTAAPLLTFNVGAKGASTRRVTGEHFTDFLEIFHKEMTRTRVPLKLAFDVTHAAPIGPMQIRDLVSFLTSNGELIERTVDSTALVVSGWLVRKCVNLVLMVYEPKRDFEMFDNLAEATRWLQTHTPTPRVPPPQN
jgi:hypothetical protein